MTAHGHHRLRLLGEKVETAGQARTRQSQVAICIYQQEGFTRIVGRWDIDRRRYFLARSIIDDQVIFRFTVIIEHRLKPSQTILQHHRTIILQLTHFIRRQTKRCQIVETLWKHDLFVLLGGVDNQVELGVKTEAASKSGQGRQWRVAIDDLKTDFAGDPRLVDLQDADGVQFQVAFHRHHGMNVHDSILPINEEIKTAIQDETRERQLADRVHQDIKLTGLIWIRLNLR